MIQRRHCFLNSSNKKGFLPELVFNEELIHLSGTEKVLFSGLFEHLNSNGEKVKEGYKGSYFKNPNIKEFVYRLLVIVLS